MGRPAEVEKGFTLLELIVTIAVLAVAAAVVAPAVGRGGDALKARAEVAGFAAAL
jgi:prepilin-type N-terminal cleavage/methylation domain-containing protein